MHVDVLERRILLHPAGLDLRRDLQQPIIDRLRVVSGKDALAAEHRRMGAAGLDVLVPQPLVDRDGGIYLAHHRGRAARKAPAPHFIGVARAADRPSPHPGHGDGGRGLR